MYLFVKEIQSVGQSMLILAFTLIFVYLVFFGVKGKTLKAEIASLSLSGAFHKNTEGSLIDTVIGSGDIEMKNRKKVIETKKNLDGDVDTEIEVLEKVIASEKPSFEPLVMKNKTFFSVQELFRIDQVKHEKVLLLREDLWQWKKDVSVEEAGLASINSVGIQDLGQYILKDMENTHYVYIGKYDSQLLIQRIEKYIESRGGNILEITKENSIDKTPWTGKEARKITTVYSDAKKKSLILLFLENKDVRFFQIDEEVLKKKKGEIANML